MEEPGKIVGKRGACECELIWKRRAQNNHFSALQILIGNAHHIDDHFPKGLLLLPRQIDKDITFWGLQQFEGNS